MSVIPSLKKITHDDYPARSRQKQYSRYTRAIDAETLLAFRYSIRLAPVFIQKRIQKKAEYRLTLISKHDVVCWIDAKHINDAEVTLDWRVTEPINSFTFPTNCRSSTPANFIKCLTS